MAEQMDKSLDYNVKQEAKIDATRKLRIGIIGCGGIAHAHVNSYKQMPDVEIVAGCDIVPGKAAAFFKEFGLELKTLYTTLMLDEGFIANVSFYPTLAHNEKIVALYAEAIDRVFAKIAEIKKGGKDAILAALDGKVCQSGFKRLLK